MYLRNNLNTNQRERTSLTKIWDLPHDQQMTHKWKQIRDRDCHLLWSGSHLLVRFQFCAYSFERWHIIIIITYLAESWVTWKSRLTLNSTHLKKNLSDGQVDVNHQKRLDLFWNVIEHFTRYSTACHCAPYCEVQLLSPVAHIWPREPSPLFCA